MYVCICMYCYVCMYVCLKAWFMAEANVVKINNFRGTQKQTVSFSEAVCMYVCIYACMYVCIRLVDITLRDCMCMQCMYVCMQYLPILLICCHVCMYVCMHGIWHIFRRVCQSFWTSTEDISPSSATRATSRYDSMYVCGHTDNIKTGWHLMSV